MRPAAARQPVYGRWVVRNAVGHSKTIGMLEAAQFSVNTYFVQLELATGMCRVTKMTKKVGVKLGTRGRDLVDYYQNIPSFTLGTVEVSPLSMTEAYATFAARGIHCKPIIISKITTRNGKSLDIPDADCRRVMSKDVADGVNKVLKSVVDKGTGQRVRIYGQGDIAGKTGTTQNNKAVWFAGYTPEIAGVSMISYDKTRKPFKNKARRGIKGYRIPSTNFVLEGSGSGDAGMKIWLPVMQKYLQKVPNTGFKEPPRRIKVGKQVRVPSLPPSYATAKRNWKRQASPSSGASSTTTTCPRATSSAGHQDQARTISQFGTVFAEFSRGPEPDDDEDEEEEKEEEGNRGQRKPKPPRPR